MHENLAIDVSQNTSGYVYFLLAVFFKTSIHKINTFSLHTS